MPAITIPTSQEWINHLEELGERIGERTKTAVLQRAVELLASSQGLPPCERLAPTRHHPWTRPGRPLPGQGEFAFGE